MEREKPEIRNMLVISTAHVPTALRAAADEHEDTSEWNTVVHVLDVGFLLWVPDVPADSSGTQEDKTHPAILAIQLHARALGCDYVMIDRDGLIVNELPVFCEECGGAIDFKNDDARAWACGKCMRANQVAAAVARDADDASTEELEAASAILDRIGPSTKR